VIIARGAAVAACAIIAAGQAPDSVTLYVAVEQADGTFVANLTPADFRVIVDDRPVEVSQVVQEDGDVSLVVLVDLTYSALWPGRTSRGNVERELVRGVIEPLAGVGRLAVGSFGRGLHLPVGLSADPGTQRDGLRRALDRPARDRTGPSPIWDVLNEAMTVLESEAGRRAIVLISDGQSTGNTVGLATVGDRAIGLGIGITVVSTAMPMQIGQTPGTAALIRPDRPLRGLASATGGAFVERPPLSKGPKSPRDPLDVAAVSQRHAYRLTIPAPAVARPFHRVVVTTTDETRVVRARAGFRGTPGITGAQR